MTMRLFSGLNFVISSKEGTVMLRLEGVVGLYLMVGIGLSSSNQFRPSKKAIVGLSSVSVTIAFFQAAV